MTDLLAASHWVYRADHAEHAFPKLQNHPLAAAAEEPFLTIGWHNSATALCRPNRSLKPTANI
jgi:hypothetical protein